MNAPLLLLCAGGGLAGGALYFALLRASLGWGGWRVIAGLALVRLAVAGGLFWLAARNGPLPLLAALAGFLAARWLMLRQARRLPP